MSTYAAALVRYSGPFLKWTREEPKQMNQKTRKRHNIPEMMFTDYMFPEMGNEEDLQALKTVSTHRYNDSRTT